MDSVFVFSFILVSSLLQGGSCLDIVPASPGGEVMYKCEGDDVVLPWKLALEGTEEVVDMEWAFNSPSIQENIAVFINSDFLSEFLPSTSYLSRVQHVGAGLLLSHMTAGDSGNYTLRVKVHDGSQFLTKQDTVQVVMAIPPLSRYDEVRVTGSPVADYDADTDQWFLTVKCGEFKNRGYPPIEVEWTTPNGVTEVSSDFANGTFYLRLPSPVAGGDFSCRLAPSSPARSCIANNSTLLDKANVTSQENTIGEGASCNGSQSTGGQGTEVLASHNGFFAVVDESAHLHVGLGDRIIPSLVTLNEGNPYNVTSGVFTAPRDGIYFVYGIGAADSFNFDTGANKVVSLAGKTNLQYNKLYTAPATASSNGLVYNIVQMAQGEQMYLTSSGRGFLKPFGTGFGAFYMG